MQQDRQHPLIRLLKELIGFLMFFRFCPMSTLALYGLITHSQRCIRLYRMRLMLVGT